MSFAVIMRLDLLGFFSLLLLSDLPLGRCDDEVNPLRGFRHDQVLTRIDSSVSLTTSTLTLNKSGEWLTLYWSGVEKPSKEDWVGLWVLPSNSSDIDAKKQAPVKYQYCYMSDTHLDKGKGKFKIRLVNMRGVNKFGLFRGGFKKPVMAAVSKPVSFTNPNEPLHGHLALTNNIEEMVLMWVTRDTKLPQVKWGTTSKQYTQQKNAESSTYTASDMCDSPAQDYGWLDPGMIHKVTLTGLSPSTKYYYVFGDESFGWSEEFSFTSAPEPGPNVVTRVLAFGDMGHGEYDDTRQVRNYEPPSLNTTRNLINEMDSHDLILDVGDISYADGYEPIWDEYFDQVKDLLVRLPCMVNPGNHESDSESPKSDSYWREDDSGGECNVPYINRFAMPRPGPDQPWYGFDYGNIHVVMMSTEHNFTTGSKQNAFLSDHMASVNRTKTPWLIFGGHRPMYVDASKKSKIAVSDLLIESIEPLLLEYNVNLALWGHHHAYERMCPVFSRVCTDGAPTHVVIGMAGRKLSGDFKSKPPPYTVMVDKDHWGYTRIATNSTTLVLEYIHNDGKVADTVVLQKLD